MTSKICSACGLEVGEFAHGRRCGDCVRAYHRRKYERRKDRVRESAYIRTYGITLKQYDAMLEAQGGRCAICESQDAGGKGRFHVDHDHKTGEVRGLLCHFCNTGLGKFRDSQELLYAAAGYLARTVPQV